MFRGLGVWLSVEFLTQGGGALALSEEWQGLELLKLPSESEVAQSCLTLCNPIDCSPPGSSVHGILQARILEQVAIPFPKGSS